ncbi:MAG: hypothetical protein IJ639_07615 [Ruminococcus sp.]|nr:hypothetical protein [Ruminococcus sp.]
MNTINNKTNNLTTKRKSFPSPSQQEGGNHSETSPYTVTVGDTTVRLHFNKEGNLTARLANAFNSMLN